MSGMGTLPPQHHPNLCVTNDDDYSRARGILQKALFENEQQADTETVCPSCSERNPGNFDICFACGTSLATAARE